MAMPVNYYSSKDRHRVISYYKPVSRILFRQLADGYHLSVLNITAGINLPTHQL
jgi:hypothetical protein